MSSFDTSEPLSRFNTKMQIYTHPLTSLDQLSRIKLRFEQATLRVRSLDNAGEHGPPAEHIWLNGKTL